MNQADVAPHSEDDTLSVDKRTIRALHGYMTVLEEVDDLYQVVSQSGSAYHVDLRGPACSCPDFRQRGQDTEWKHIRRVKLETGAVAIGPVRHRLELVRDQRRTEIERLEAAKDDLKTTIRAYEQALTRLEDIQP